MPESRLVSIFLIILGVLLIVFGAGVVTGGMAEQQAAEEGETPEQEEYCTTINENMSYNEYVEKRQNASSDEEREELHEEYEEGLKRKCMGTETPENPNSGGGTDILTGTVMVLIGGVSLYGGARG